MQYKRNKDSLDIYIDQSLHQKPLSFFFDSLHIGRKLRYLTLIHHELLLNHQPIKQSDTILKKGDILTLNLATTKPVGLGDGPLCHVVFENDFVLVVHKDAGYIIHSDDDQETLNTMVERYLYQKGIYTKALPIHRLDKETSGLVLYVKIPFFKSYFDDALQQRHIHREYLAITKGKRLKSLDIQDPIGKDRHHNNRYMVLPNGSTAHTSITLVKEKDGLQLYACTLHTGRTHQIRVHLSHHGLPIVNDDIYGVKDTRIRGMGLWAYQLTFKDPLSHKRHKILDTKNPVTSFFD